MKLHILLLVGCFATMVSAQNVGINRHGQVPDPSALLDLNDTSSGFLVPRLTQPQIATLSNPADGLMLFNLTTGRFNYYYQNYWFQLHATCLNPPPPPSLNYTNPAIEGDTLHLTASLISGAQYVWQGPNGFTAQVQNPKRGNLQLTDAGLYTCIAIVNTCTTNVSSILVNVQPAPRRVFVTSNPVTPFTSGLTGLDALCQQEAQAAGLSGTYKAWVSSSTVDVRDRITQSAYGYRLVDGTLIANSWNDLIDGTLLNPIQKDANGNLVSNQLVKTNTYLNGTKAASNNYFTCYDFTSNDGLISSAGMGRTNEVNFRWTQNATSDVSCATSYRIYCFEQ